MTDSGSPADVVADAAQPDHQPSPVHRAGSARRRRLPASLILGLVLLGGIAALAVAAPLFGSQTYQDFQRGLTDAGLPVSIGSPGFPLGSDTLGRDLLPRLAYGGRISLTVAVVSTVTSVGLGLIVGVVAGYYRRGTESVLLRLADIALALPFTLAALAIAALIPAGMTRVILIITLLFWAYPARLFYGEVLALRTRTFIAAAEASGVPRPLIVWRHIRPHITPLVWTYAPLNAAAAVGFEATLSFLGAGVNPPGASWGNMISEGEDAIFYAPHLLIEPAVMILLATMSFLLIGAGLKGSSATREEVSWLDV
jgi:peptide/nickel transport system permease protein